MEKMIDPNIIDYYIINCAIPSIITIENRYQIDFGKPGMKFHLNKCNLLRVTRRKKPITISYRIREHLLEEVQTAKYPGKRM